MPICSLLAFWDGGDRTLDCDRTLNAGLFITGVLGWG